MLKQKFNEEYKAVLEAKTNSIILGDKFPGKTRIIQEMLSIHLKRYMMAVKMHCLEQILDHYTGTIEDAGSFFELPEIGIRVSDTMISYRGQAGFTHSVSYKDLSIFEVNKKEVFFKDEFVGITAKEPSKEATI